MSMIKKMHDSQDAKIAELKKSGFEFSPSECIKNFDLSISDVDDLLALAVGESTYIDCEVTRLK